MFIGYINIRFFYTNLFSLCYLFHQSKFLAHQLGFPLLVSIFIKNFLVYSQHNNVMEKNRPGIPNKKKSSLLPPNTLLIPGTYNNTINNTV